MPLLGLGSGFPALGLGRRGTTRGHGSEAAAPLFPACAFAGCRSGRIHLWRNRGVPRIEGGWTCSPACTEARMRELIGRELAGYGEPAEPYRHRVPLGLVLLGRGWIDQPALQRALAAHRAGDRLRTGEWLVRHAGLSEQRVTEALSLQWNCPVFSGEIEARVLASPPLPRILIEACGVLPLRWTSGGALRLGFPSAIDHRLALAIERLSAAPVEAGLLSASAYARCRGRLLDAPFARVRLLEAVGPGALASALARQIERSQPVETRLVRYDRYFWMRMWTESARESSATGSEDVIAALGEMPEHADSRGPSVS